jgi:hypothetical protein
MGPLRSEATFPLERLCTRAHIPFAKVRNGEPEYMSNPSWDPTTSDGYDDPQARGLDPYDPCEIDPPAPLQLLIRLCLLLLISLAFGVGAELLVRLPPH